MICLLDIRKRMFFFLMVLLFPMVAGAFFFESAYMVGMQNSYDFSLSPQINNSLPSTDVELTADSFFINWSSFHVGAGINHKNGLYAGISVDFQGYVYLMDTLRIDLHGAKTSGMLPQLDIIGIYDVQEIQNDVAIAGEVIVPVGSLSINNGKLVDTDLPDSSGVSALLFLESISNRLVAMSVGYHHLSGTLQPFAEFSLGLDNTKMKFTNISEIQEWSLSYKYKVGVAYKASSGILPYISYALKISTLYDYNSVVTPLQYDVYPVDTNLVSSSSDVLEENVFASSYVNRNDFALTMSGIDEQFYSAQLEDNGEVVLANGTNIDSNLVLSSGATPPTITQRDLGSLLIQANEANGSLSLASGNLSMDMHYKYPGYANYYTKPVTSNNNDVERYQIQHVKSIQHLFEVGIRIFF
ncbi:MAG: hypothetical protein P857_587 [Candidatus Xenolissoclinum pacificiensis L6]|uniref:Uncharacterized protein n=1 Tax=Candidatus Xenolissoclinum pacificiensis L6 TaxID=1401685 RepID=W2UYA1_9RICK|nr:MAG: hypothetical protein P857_587 [Candidatus Xenolissoclinum pacificiensis L6]